MIRGAMRWAMRRTVVGLGLALLALTTLQAERAGAQVWIGPTVGIDTPVIRGLQSDGETPGPGVGADPRVRIFRSADLTLGVYWSSLSHESDEFPVLIPLCGVRWRRPINEGGDLARPYVAVGAGFPFVEAEVGFDLARRSILGLEAGSAIASRSSTASRCSSPCGSVSSPRGDGFARI